MKAKITMTLGIFNAIHHDKAVRVICPGESVTAGRILYSLDGSGAREVLVRLRAVNRVCADPSVKIDMDGLIRLSVLYAAISKNLDAIIKGSK